MKKIVLSVFIFASLILVPTIGLYAQRDIPGGSGNSGGNNNGSVERLVSPIEAKSTAKVLNAFFDVLIQIGAVAVTLAIIYAGFLFVVARGNPEQLNKARVTLFWTIIGALILLGSKVIASVIEETIKTVGK